MTTPESTFIQVKPDAPKAKKGIIINVNRNETYGKVIAVGDKVSGVAKGNRIIYMAKNQVENDGYHFIDEEMIIGII